MSIEGTNKAQFEALKLFAKQNGLFFESEVTFFESLDYSLELNTAGSEHNVYTTKSTEELEPFVYKSTKEGWYGHRHLRLTLAQYLLRVYDFNQVFPNLAMVLVGVTEDGRIWTKQALILGQVASSLPDLIQRLNNFGWKQLSHNCFVNVHTKVKISDATSANILFDDKGVPHFIDVIVDDLGKLQVNKFFDLS